MPPGVARLRHATTLTERVYVDHGEAVEREAICQLQGIWPDEVQIFSARSQKAVGQSTECRYSASATLENPDMPTTTQRTLTERPAIQASSGSSVAARPQGPGRSVRLRGESNRADATRKDANGQVRTFSRQPHTAEDEVALTLARWLDSRRARSQEHDDDDQRQRTA